MDDEIYIPNEIRTRIYWQAATLVRDPCFVSILTKELVNSLFMLLEELPKNTALLEQPCEELRDAVKKHVRLRGLT